MYGALLGDMIGAPYEFDRGNKSKEFPLFCENSRFTDDSVMTIAVAEALLDGRFLDDDSIRAALIKSMRKWGKKYPDAGYGRKFLCWLREKDPKPYGSCGNGSAMRVSAAGWLFDTLEETREKARLTAEVTHDHPEGIKGAEAASSAIFLARTGRSKEELRDYIVQEFGYDLSRTCDQIRPSYYHNESCQKTVPEAITAFLEGTDFEDVIRTAVSLGGDCDTLTCIAGSIAEAFYGVPAILKAECKRRLPEDMAYILGRFDISRKHGHDDFPGDTLSGSGIIDEAIDRGCQTGRPGTDNGHLAPVGTNGFGFGRRVAIIFQDGRLNFRNINRKINPAAGAGFHTELIRANQTAGLPHRIIPGDGGDRLFKIAVLAWLINSCGLQFTGQAFIQGLLAQLRQRSNSAFSWTLVK